MKQFLTLILSILNLAAPAQTTKTGYTGKVYTSDIRNFWVAYDSVLKVTDTITQQAIIQTLYLDKATGGLKEFMIARQHSAKRHLNHILKYPNSGSPR